MTGRSSMRRWLLPVLLLPLGAAGAAAADPGLPPTNPVSAPAGPVAPVPEAQAKDFLSQDFLTGDWGGARTRMSDRGVTWEFFHFSEGIWNPTGGRSSGAVYEGGFRAGLTLDLEKLLDWQGWSFSARGIYRYGPSPTAEHVGDLNFVSGYDAYDTLRLYDLWLQKTLWDNKLSIKAGQMASDEEFGYSDSWDPFMNSTMGYPTVFFNLPSPITPAASPGVRVRVDPLPEIYFQAAVFEGDGSLKSPNTRLRLGGDAGLYSIFETGYKLNQQPGDKGLPGTYKLGGWYSTRDFSDQRFDANGLSLADPASSGIARTLHDDYGVYLAADQAVWKGSGDAQLNLFAFAGGAPADRNLVNLDLQGGLNWHGANPRRPKDVLGVGMAYTEVSPDLADLNRESNAFNGTSNPISDYEWVTEVTYQVVLAPWWEIQPDIQYVAHPGGSSALPDAVVLGVRTKIQF